MSDVPFPVITSVRDLAGAYVLLRASLNVPIVDGVVTNRFRITRALPTINYLAAHGARTIVIAHIGREPEESLRPVFEELHDLLPTTAWCGQVTGDEPRHKRDALDDGDVLMLENLRSDAGETANDEAFARNLASLADIYVNDAFAVSHREHASIVGVPNYLPSYAGCNFIQEYETLLGARNPQSPALCIVGGAKFDTKLPLVERLLGMYDHVFVGGALAHDIWRVRGYELGTSLVSDVDLTDSTIIDAPNLLLPVDVTVRASGYTRVTTPDDVKPDEIILDAGPKTVDMLAGHVDAARSILWNGPLGNYEEGFRTATERLARIVADAPGHSIVGGGDTIASIEACCLQDGFDFLSTAGGAMLTLLEHGTVPGVDALRAQKTL